MQRTPVQQPQAVDHFPFGLEFQQALIHILCEDVTFAQASLSHLKPGYFEHEALSWAFSELVRYWEKYNTIPKLAVLFAEADKLEPATRDIYRLVLQRVVDADLEAEDWLRDKVIDFIRRNIFVRAHQEAADQYNRGEVDQAYELIMEAAEKIWNTDWGQPDREFFFENFAQRMSDRLSYDPRMESVATGIGALDHILGGGLGKGELGVWIAHSKRGKTTMLANHGVQAVRRGQRNVLHLVFEGARQQVAARYDTIFAQEAYADVRRGRISQDRYDALQYEYQMYQKKLVLRGFTERWDYTVADIAEELKELKRLHRWVPDLIIVDYGDLLRGRGKHKNETEHQTAAFRDLKALANRGYAVWTASQPQRPKHDPDMKSEILMAKNIADAYAKIRVADFIGSLNQTKEEREAKQMRVYAELYRDNAADQIIYVHADFATMTISGATQDPVLPQGQPGSPPMGYTGQIKQLRGPA